MKRWLFAWWFVALIAIAAFFAGGSVVKGMWRKSAAASWVQLPAHIESASMKTTVRKTGLAPWLDCEYRYEFQGRSYKSKRLALVPERTRDKDWLATWELTLQAAQERDEPILCFVDPGDPTQAVLDRTVTLGDMASAMIFLPVAVAYFAAYTYHRREERKTARRKY